MEHVSSVFLKLSLPSNRIHAGKWCRGKVRHSSGRAPPVLIYLQGLFVSFGLLLSQSDDLFYFELCFKLCRDESHHIWRQHTSVCVCVCLRDSLEDGIVGVVRVAHSVCTPKQHLERNIWDQSSQLLKSLPGTLGQEAHGHIKRST